MSTFVVIGAGIATVILLLFVPFIFARVHDFQRSNRYEWASFRWTIERGGSFVASGSSYRREDLDYLDAVAAMILEEWFESPDGQRALRSFSHRTRYSCLVQLDGRVGKSWG